MPVENSPAQTPGFWSGSWPAWALVCLSLGLAQAMRLTAPLAVIEQALRAPQGPYLRSLLGLVAISCPAVFGLWRLAPRLRLPKALAFLYLVFPVAVLAVFIVWPLVERFRRPR